MNLLKLSPKKASFVIRKLRDGDVAEETRGRAKLSGPGEAGQAEFTQPEASTVELPRGTMFPTEHTLLLIRSAMANETMAGDGVCCGPGSTA